MHKLLNFSDFSKIIFDCFERSLTFLIPHNQSVRARVVQSRVEYLERRDARAECALYAIGVDGRAVLQPDDLESGELTFLLEICSEELPLHYVFFPKNITKCVRVAFTPSDRYQTLRESFQKGAPLVSDCQ